MKSENSLKLKECVFYGILDTGYVAPENMLQKCKELIASGAGIIQLRAKKETSFERAKIANEIAPLFDELGSPIFIINDDIELAASLKNAGLHIGQDDISPIEARKILGANKVLGLSTHSAEQAKKANELSEILDYFAVGPVYATNTKPGRIPVGLELVEQVSKMDTILPWFAIGGVNMRTAKAVAKAGAPRIVAVSEVLIAQDTTKAVKELIKEFKS